MLTTERITKPIQIIQYHGSDSILLVPDYIMSANINISAPSLTAHNGAVVLLTAQTDSSQNGMYKYTGSSLTPYFFDFFHNVKKIYKIKQDSSYLIYNGPTDHFNQFYTINKDDIVIIINKSNINVPYDWYTYDKVLPPKIKFNEEIIINNFCALGTRFNTKNNEIILDLNSAPSYPIVLTSEAYNGVPEDSYYTIVEYIQHPDIDHKNLISYNLEKNTDFSIDVKGNLILNENLVADGLNGLGKLAEWKVLSVADPAFLSNNLFAISSQQHGTRIYEYNTGLENPYLNNEIQDLVKYPFSLHLDSNNIVHEKRYLIKNNVVLINGLSSSTFINSSAYINQTGLYEIRVRLYSLEGILLSEDRIGFNVKQLMSLPTPTPTPTPSGKKHTVSFDAGPILEINDCEDCYKDFLSVTVSNMCEECRYYYEFGVYAFGNKNPDKPEDDTNLDDITFTQATGVINSGNTTENIRTLMTTGIGKIRTTIYVKVINLDNYTTSINYLTIEKCERDFCALTPTPTASKALKSYPPRTPTKTKTPTPTQTSTQTSTPTPTPTKPLAPPDAPTSLVAVSGNASASLSWVAPGSGSIVRGYIVEYSSNAGATWIQFGSEVSQTLTTVTGLTNGTAYLFRVAAVNGSFTGPYVTSLTVTPIASVPAAPSVTSVLAGNTEITINWSIPNNGGAPIQDYIIQYSDDVGSSWSTLSRSPSLVTSATITGLTNGKAYIFRVAAINSTGTGPYSVNSSNATPATVPTAPTNVVLNTASSNFSLTWTAPSNGGAPITDYRIEYSSNGGSSWSIFNDAVTTANSSIITGLVLGSTYSFRVAAINRVGIGPYTTTAPTLYATVPSAPSTITATLRSGAIDLQWSVSTANGSAILDYTIQSSSDGGVTWINVGSPLLANLLTIASSNIVLGSTYSFRVYARNSIGNSSYTYSNPVTVDPEGQILTWGNNNVSQLGDGLYTAKNLPSNIADVAWSKLYMAGVGYPWCAAIALTTDGKLYSWGAHTNGLTGQNTTTGITYAPVRLGSSSNWTKVFMGERHVLAINSLGELWAWGSNSDGKLGLDLSTSNVTLIPTKVGNATNWVSAAVSNNASAMINSSGELFIAGSGYFGFNSTPAVYNTPTKINVNGVSGWKSVALGSDHMVAISTDGRMFVVGVNGTTGTAGLGAGTPTNVTTITQIGSLNNWQKVIASDQHTLAINANGQLFGWGNNARGQLGLGSILSVNAPTQIGSSNNWLSDYIVTASDSTLAINSNNELYGWGSNNNGLFGLSTPSASNLILKIRDVSNVTSLAISDHASGIVQDTVLYFSGDTGYTIFPGPGKVYFSRFSPLPSVSNNSNYTQISAGAGYFVTSNNLGEHFIGGNQSSYINAGLRRITTNTNNVKSVKAGGTGYYLTLDANNTLSMWILNGPQATVQLSVKKFAAGLTKAIFINSANQLMQYSYTTRNTSQVTGASGSWIDVFASGFSDSFAALDSIGQLWTWGTNNFGQLGLGDTAVRNSPVQVGVQTWRKIAIGTDFMFGINTAGQLWSWGNNSTGQLGNPIGSYSFVPVRVGSLSDWTHVSAGSSHGAAINTDKELWTWGSNNFGQLGNGNSIAQTSPIQVGTTHFWLDVTAGDNFTVGLKAQLII